MMEPCDLSATEALTLIRAGQLTAVDVLQSCLGRINDREPSLHALAHWDAELARSQAKAADPSPLLGGLPFGVKDVIDTAQMPASYGSPIWQGHRPKADAACVAWARTAGGVVLGKTHTTEFAVRHPGPTTHPQDARYTPGGSSSGSAAGVAAGYFPFAVATQTAGSAIRPAAFCGVVGYKPTFGMVPRLGMKIMSESLDTISVIARTVRDCALLVHAMSQRPLQWSPWQSGDKLRIGLCRTYAWDRADAATQELIERAATRLAGQLGESGSFECIELGLDFNALPDWHMTVQYFESARSMGWEWAHHREALSDDLQSILASGLGMAPSEYDAARSGLARLRSRWDELTAHVDVVITPAATGEAPEGLSWTGDPVFNSIWSALHVPCVTVPAGKGPRGLPLGIQLVGRPGADAQLLRAAERIQQLLA